MCFFFFFQAEDGIRDYKVTGVQTCALPISRGTTGAMTDEPSLKELGERLERLDAPIRMWREQRDRAFAAAFGPQKGKLSSLMGRLPQAANAAAALGLGPR